MAEGVRRRGGTWYFTIRELRADGARRPKERRAVDAGFPNTERGASQARRAALAQQDRGLTPSGRTVQQIVERYITEAPDLKPRSRGIYTKTLARYITPHLGARNARELGPADVRGWHVKLQRAQLSPATISVAHALLSGALQLEVMDERLARNVARLVRPPGAAKRDDPPAWDAATIARFVSCAADDRDGALWTLLILTGLRIGEALALTWAHVDLEQATLSVRRTWSEDERGRRVISETPKRPASRRDLILSAPVVTQLRAHRDRGTFQRGRALSSALVFPLHGETARLRLAAFCAAHGFPHVTPHALRHIHASWLVSIGAEQRAITARLGHSRLSMLDHYAHLTPGAEARLSATLSERLRAAGEPLEALDGTADGSVD